jgi:hypothetical protein
MSEVEARFEALSRALATGHTRRGVLKLGVALVGAGVASAFAGRASARPLRIESSREGNSDCEAFCKVICEGTAGTGEEASNCHGMCTSAAGMNMNDPVPTSLCARCAKDVANICGDFDPTNPEGALCCLAPDTCCPSVTSPDRCCHSGQLCCAGGGRCVGPCSSGQIPHLGQCRCCFPSGSPCAGSACCSGFCTGGFFGQPSRCA